MLRHIPLEAVIWLTGLVLLFCLETGSTHYSICPLKNAGIDFCPGCGLGTSVSLLFKGRISASLETHPLGIFAVIVLSFRIINLTRLFIRNYGKSY